MRWLMTSVSSHCANKGLTSTAPEMMSELLIRVTMGQHKAHDRINSSGLGIHKHVSVRRRAACVYVR